MRFSVRTAVIAVLVGQKVASSSVQAVAHSIGTVDSDYRAIHIIRSSGRKIYARPDQIEGIAPTSGRGPSYHGLFEGGPAQFLSHLGEVPAGHDCVNLNAERRQLNRVDLRQSDYSVLCHRVGYLQPFAGRDHAIDRRYIDDLAPA